MPWSMSKVGQIGDGEIRSQKGMCDVPVMAAAAVSDAYHKP
jgi:hypothetical protein